MATYRNINERGYGFIPRMVMQDKRLTVEAKAIYAYYSSYSTGKAALLPDKGEVIDDLGISPTVYDRHLALLRRYGYISITPQQLGSGGVRNIFTLEQHIPM